MVLTGIGSHRPPRACCSSGSQRGSSSPSMHLPPPALTQHAGGQVPQPLETEEPCPLSWPQDREPQATQSPLPCCQLCAKNHSLPAHLRGQAYSLGITPAGPPQAFLHPPYSRSRPPSSGDGPTRGGEHRGPLRALCCSMESSLHERKQVEASRNPFLVELPLEPSEG